MSPSMMSLCAWSFAINTHTFKADLFFAKLEEIMPSKIGYYSIKDLSRIVWSLCKVLRDNDVICKVIEEEISKRELSGKEGA